MHITKIEVSDLKSTEGTARGFVSLHCEEGNVQMHCSIVDAEDRNPRLALISEALRQLARMPEFRSGRRSFSFSNSIRDADPALA